MDKICLNPDYSTTRLLVKGSPAKTQFIAKGPDGGLRKAGYTKAADETNPLVCIITVTFNGAPLLEKTIRSVLELSYPNVEYIVIDGGSKDGTLDILKKYEDRIDYWISERDEGIYDAMNKGWLLANDDAFILFIGSGDTIISLPENVMQYKNADVIYGMVLTGEGRRFVSQVNFKLRLSNTLHHQALLIKKSVHLQPPFDTHFKKFADFDFNQRLLKQKCKFQRAENFLAASAPVGFSGTPDLNEVTSIIRKNFGSFWAWLYIIHYYRIRTEKLIVSLFKKR